MGSTGNSDDRAVFFFDIDNCLYPKSRNVQLHMGRLINQYFEKYLNMPEEEAGKLHIQYYKDYGLSVEGLSRHYGVDPLDFNQKVDDALPLEDLLSPDPEVRKILESFDKTKVKMWLFTNGHVSHARRVVNILKVADLFEGLTYCDYSQSPLVPKPYPAMFEKAEREASVAAADYHRVYFVDDSYLNCRDAYARGWQGVVHLVEPEIPDPPTKACKHQISHLRELLGLFPDLLKKAP